MTDFDLNAEAAVIGGLLVNPEECAESAFSALEPKCFESGPAAEIFTIGEKAHADGKPFDAALLREQITDPDTRAYALACAESFVSAAAYPAYIAAVRSAARRRRITGKMQELLFSGADADILTAELNKLLEEEQEHEADAAGNMHVRLMQYEQEIYEPVDAQGRIRTGFPRLDRTLNGLRKGSLSYLGAAPSSGKTTLALNMAWRALRDGRRVQFFSLEMSTEQLLDRLFSADLLLPYDKIDDHTLPEADKHRMAQAVAGLYSNSNFLIVDNQYFLEGIAHSIAQFRPDFVVIDFLQNVRTREKFQTRKNQVDYISAECKRLARVNNCHVMVLSQINRAGEQGAPRMSDLKESGNLEADADQIMLLYRPYVSDKTDAHSPAETALLVDKNKYGRCGTLRLSFDGQHQRFSEVEDRYA